MAQVRAEIRVTGRVQGVWFRQSTRQTAEQLGICGWVKNQPDGSVAAVFEGEERAVRALINWCEHGPELAQVDDLQLAWKEPSGEFSDFRVR